MACCVAASMAGKVSRRRPPLERGVDDAALAFPDLAIGDKDGIAEEGAQPLGDAGGFGEVVGAFGQDAGDQGGVVDQIAAKERRAKLGHPGVIEPRGLG